ncbi:MAG: M20 metallopeptidase family protein [Bacillota bacterium]
MDKKKIFKMVEDIEDEIIEIRHIIHQNPELAYEEKETAALVEKELKKLDLKVKSGIYHTGVCGLLENSNSENDKTILLRADMDALPIQENTGKPYSSKNDGIMHACGHDGHTAILIGVAILLNKLKNEFNGNVKFVFQPAEEAEGGAQGMIEEGVLENPEVDAALGLHLWGTSPKGVVEYKSGPFMASPDKFTLKVLGEGGHAAQPEKSIDPIPIATSIVNQFQNIISRRTDPLESAVISVCHIEGGDTHNVIPNEVFLEGTVRSLVPEVRDKLPEYMEKAIKKVTSIYGADYDFDYEYRFPPLINDENMAELLSTSARKILGDSRVRELKKANMGGEDFSYFAESVPANFFYLGMAPSKREVMKHHQDKFDVDDEVLKDGMAVIVQTVIDYFKD